MYNIHAGAKPNNTWFSGKGRYAEYMSIFSEMWAGDLESSPYYYKFLQALLRLLAADDNLLEDRGAFIIR